MKKIAFNTELEAKSFATSFAENNNGYIAKNTVTVGVGAFDAPVEIDSWSGEIDAYEVVDSTTHSTIAYVAFWE